MTESKDSLGRLFVDIGVTLVLVFSGIGVAGIAAEWIAPRVGGVYMLCLLGALVPVGLWLRRCRVDLFFTRAQFAAFVFSFIGVSFVAGFPQPNPWALPGWAMAAILMGTFRLSEQLFERVPMLRTPAEEPTERVEG